MTVRVTCQAILVVGCVAAVGCKPSDVLSVPAPTGVLPAGALATQSGAEQLEGNGVDYLELGFAGGYYGLVQWSGLLSDEFRWTDYFQGPGNANVDARMTQGVHGYSESGDYAIQNLMTARFTLLTALPLLEQHEPASGRSKIGLAFAMMGYTELLAAEDYCAGLPLATPTASGFAYGEPLTTDALLAIAEADFDSALAYTASDSVAQLARVGLGRTRLDRGNFAGAASAVTGVPTSFIYNAIYSSSYGPGILSYPDVYGMYAIGYGCSQIGTANGKGQNGLNYIAANDPRLVFNTTVTETCNFVYAGWADSIWYYPAKFGNPSTAVPLATGVEARLIEAEAALHAGQTGTWTADLNALRVNAPSTYLALASGMAPLTTDSTTTASATLQVDVMFRERAFWLFGLGSRLGDMRRLIRQYGRDQGTVFPVGPYPGASAAGLPSPLPTYGTDVNLTLPTAAGGLSDPNPHYKGCTTSTAAA